MLDGLVPGCTVELRIGATVVGNGIADTDGNMCVGVDLKNAAGEAGQTLSARMFVCGQAGPFATTPLLKESALPKPVVGGPLFGCQTSVPLSNLHIGAPARLQTDMGDIGSFCSCWQAVNVNIGFPLVPNSKVRAQQYWDGRACKSTGPWSEWQLVVAPDQRIKPKVLDPLIDGDQVIRVDNQIAGASLVIRISPAQAQPPTEFGPRPASTHPEIALNVALAAGNVVTVVQTLCRSRWNPTR